MDELLFARARYRRFRRSARTRYVALWNRLALFAIFSVGIAVIYGLYEQGDYSE